MQKELFDCVILGGGKGGKTLAQALGKAGKKTALIEKAMIGGSCINVACIPTKTMIYSSKIAEIAMLSREYGIEVKTVHPLLSAIVERKNSVVAKMRQMNFEQITHTKNLTFLLGKGRFIDQKTLEVRTNEGEKRILTADKVVINTGSRPSIPAIEGIENISYYTSASLMEKTTLPKHLLIVGGGYIGLEFAQMFRRFGSQVTLIHHHEQLLGREDPDVAQEITHFLEQEGIKIHLNAKPLKVSQKNGVVELEIQEKEKILLQGSDLLVATGRWPNTEELNLAATSVEVNERRFIKVNERLQTSHPDIYALGDVNGGPQFTHVSFDDYRIASSQLIGEGMRTTKNRLIPYTVFLDPQLGRVGMTEKEATEKGYTYKIAKIPVNVIPRSFTTGETKGFIKALVDEKTGYILGCACLSSEGGEILGALQIAMLGKLHYTLIRDAIFSHPTLVEGFNMLFAHL